MGRVYKPESQGVGSTGGAMLYYALVFLVIGLIAGFSGLGGVALRLVEV
jgi:hypothetical protein